jgi:hypothetical protein
MNIDLLSNGTWCSRPLEVSTRIQLCQQKHTLYDDGTMLGKYKVCDGLNEQAAPESHSCNLILHDMISEAHSLSDLNIGKNEVDIQKRNCNISVTKSS